MSSISPNEAVRIIEALAAGEISPDRALKAALAATKPKGPFPRHLTPTIDQLILPSGHVSYRKKGEHMFAVSPNEKDAETVAWLQHRGADLQRLIGWAEGMDCYCATAEPGEHHAVTAHDGDCEWREIAEPFLAILDNAEASE